MGAQKNAGFTIVEVVLFLGISSLLIVTFIVGTGTSINTQRYRDATETLKSSLQKQYTELSSVQNSRTDNFKCASNGTISDQGPTVNDARGQSDCALVGKYIRIQDDDIAVYQVLGVGTPNSAITNDILSLKNNYVLNVSKTEVDESKMEWGTQIAWPSSINGGPPSPTSPRRLAILIVRSPDSGQIYTFSANDTDVPDKANIGPISLANMLIAGNTVPGQGSQLICVDSNGLLDTSDRSVYINSFASSPSAVELRTNAYMASQGITTKC